MTNGQQEYDTLIALSKDILVVLYVWADFHEACTPGGQMDQILKVLESKYPKVRFARIEAETFSDIVSSLGVSMVPSFVLLHGGRKVDLVEGAQPAVLQKAIEKYQDKPGSSASLEKRIESIISSAHVVLFMKGSSAEPRCKFSREMVSILNDNSVPFVTFDILQDNDIREGLKVYANWPTYPQLYVGGKLIGGLDIVKDLVEEGELQDTIMQGGKDAIASNGQHNGGSVVRQSKAPTIVNDAYLSQLVSRAPVMLFMKGSPQSPNCGFSAQIVSILQEANITFDSFDILADEEVRQKLKAFSNWPTYPQLYVNGKLVGGLDIVRDLQEEEDDLATALGIMSLEERIKTVINKAPIMLFMKGSPGEPRCGFSKTIVGILDQYKPQISYETFDILEDEEIRQGLKKFSNWPTYPQLYVQGKLVGGLDIVQDLHEDGELEQVLKSN